MSFRKKPSFRFKSRNESQGFLIDKTPRQACVQESSNMKETAASPAIVPDVSAFNQCGVVWVKFPAGSRGNSWKVWDMKFVGIKSELVLRPEAVTTCVLLVVHRTEKPDSEVIFKKRLTSQNAIIFRSK